MKTLAGAAIGGARKTYKHTDVNAPLRSNATLEAVGGTAVYLCSDAGACTTGEIIRVDGGFHVLGMPQPDHLSAQNSPDCADTLRAWIWPNSTARADMSANWNAVQPARAAPSGWDDCCFR